MIMIILLHNYITPLPIIVHTGCMDSTSSTTVVIIDSEPIPVSSGLSGEHSCRYQNHQCIATIIVMRLY